jgi:tRNA A-37 threonylcarbamoyl transferase component Bud32
VTESTQRLSSALADRYRILRHLGEGGMATVYLAEDLKHKRQVAVKVLKPELAAVLGAERFIQEITTTASLQHPHILPLFDSGEADSFLYYVMPYIEGETLRTKLDRETQFGIDEAVKITTEVADALDYAHRNGIIHRDIKPENILLHDGRPMVADFGIALAVSAAAGGRMTETGLSLGTPHYMSPEQATAEKEITARADVYSLGSVLYEMLAGEPPHLGNSAQQIIMKIIADDARPVTDLRKSVPLNVAAALARSLEKLPADRFATAAKFAEALSDSAFTVPRTGSQHAPGPGRVGWQRRIVVPLAVAAPLAIIAALWGWLRPPLEVPAPVIRYTMAFPDGQTLQPQWGTSLAVSPDGSRLVYLTPGEQRGELWSRERDQLHGTRLVGTEGAWHPFFSPDGQRVGFVTDERGLKVVSLTGEPPFTVADSGLWRVGGSWGTDGFLYVSLQRFGTTLARLPIDGGEGERVTSVDSARGELIHGWPDVLPSGKGVLFTVMYSTNNVSERDEVAVVDLATGRHHALVQGILGRYAAGYLIFVRSDGSVLAAPFDQDELELTGPPVPLFNGIDAVPGTDFALSPSGRLAYATGASLIGATGEVVWVDRAGRTEELDPGWLVTANFSSGPTLSPDGKRLAITVQDADGGDIWIKDLDGGLFSRLTFDGNSNAPMWSHDGRFVLYRSEPELSYDIRVRRADGTGPAEMLLAWYRDIGHARWSNDGQWLLVATDPPLDVYVIRPGTDSVPTPLLAEEFSETAPVMSPDGRWLAYVSNESGRNEVYVRSFPNVRDTKRQVSTEGGVEPMWAHSGDELFYKNAARQLVAATVRTVPTFVVVERQALFTVDPVIANYLPMARYDVAPDDQRFLMYRPSVSGDSLPGVTVVENFLEEVKARVGN